MTNLEKVLRECERWGISAQRIDFITRGDDEDDERRHCNPSQDAVIYWPRRRIRYTAYINASRLLHELAHCIVDTAPRYVEDEVDNGMLAVEWEAQRRLKLGAEWQNWMEDYNILDGPWGLCSARARAVALHDSRLAAFANGLIDRRGKPTYRKMAPLP